MHFCAGWGDFRRGATAQTRRGRCEEAHRPPPRACARTSRQTRAVEQIAGDQSSSLLASTCSAQSRLVVCVTSLGINRIGWRWARPHLHLAPSACSGAASAASDAAALLCFSALQNRGRRTCLNKYIRIKRLHCFNFITSAAYKRQRSLSKMLHKQCASSQVTSRHLQLHQRAPFQPHWRGIRNISTCRWNPRVDAYSGSAGTADGGGDAWRASSGSSGGAARSGGSSGGPVDSGASAAGEYSVPQPEQQPQQQPQQQDEGAIARVKRWLSGGKLDKQKLAEYGLGAFAAYGERGERAKQRRLATKKPGGAGARNAVRACAQSCVRTSVSRRDEGEYVHSR